MIREKVLGRDFVAAAPRAADEGVAGPGSAAAPGPGPPRREDSGQPIASPRAHARGEVCPRPSVISLHRAETCDARNKHLRCPVCTVNAGEARFAEEYGSPWCVSFWRRRCPSWPAVQPACRAGAPTHAAAPMSCRGPAIKMRSSCLRVRRRRTARAPRLPRVHAWSSPAPVVDVRRNPRRAGRPATTEIRARLRIHVRSGCAWALTWCARTATPARRGLATPSSVFAGSRR